MAIPTTTQELRQFLDQCVNETKPVTYTDRGGHTHLVFLTQVDEVTVRTKAGRDESALALTMIETMPETPDEDPGVPPVTARKQELFLLQCVDATAPIEYQDRLNRKHRVFLTRMSLARRAAKARPDEWQYQLTMVDAWGGVWVYALPKVKVSVATTTRFREHAPDLIGSAGWVTPGSIGFAEVGGPAAPFSPADLAGLRLWVQADAIVGLNDGDPVGLWLDQTAYGNDLAQNDLSKKPLYKVNILNGRPALRFDGANDFLQAAWGLGQPNHIFVVAIQRSASQYSRLFDGATGKNAVSQWNGSSPTTLYVEAASYRTTGLTWTTNAAHLVRAKFNGASSALALDSGAYDTQDIGVANVGGITLCADKDGAYIGRFDVCEVLVYDSILSPGDEANVMAYLNARWGVY